MPFSLVLISCSSISLCFDSSPSIFLALALLGSAFCDAKHLSSFDAPNASCSPMRASSFTRKKIHQRNERPREKDTRQRPPPRSSTGEESCKEREGEKESISSSVESIRMGGKSKDSVRRKREEIYLQKA